MDKRKTGNQAYPKVAIIVLNWNNWKDTIECLKILKGLKYPEYEISVIDNGSTDNSIKYIHAVYPDLHLIQTGKNLGYAGGNNIGIAYALNHNARYVLVLNNDIKLEVNALTNMVEAARDSDASIVGAMVKDIQSQKVLFAKSRYPLMFFFSERQQPELNKNWWETDRVEGSAMLLCHEFLQERKRSIGCFLASELFLYCEEIELAMWCRANGKKSVVASQAIAYHKVSASSGGKGRPLQFYYLTRNRVLIARQYLNKSCKILFFAIYPIWRLIRCGMYICKGHKEAANAILQGLMDGIKGKTGPKAC